MAWSRINHTDMDFIVEVYVILFIIAMVMTPARSLKTDSHQDDNFALTTGHNENLDSSPSDNKFGVMTTEFLLNMDFLVEASMGLSLQWEHIQTGLNIA